MNLSISARLDKIKAEIRELESKYHRKQNSTTLLAVSKTKSVQEIAEAVAHGQKDFGESYIQEAVKKISYLQDKNLRWHFIGPIQKNKTKLIAEHFDWVHSIDRLIIAERLNAQRSQSLPPIQACIQVNIGNETTKSGIPIEHVQNLAKSISKFSQIKLRGLMAIPQICNDINIQRLSFKQLRIQLEKLNELGLNLDTLSMGMSNDMEAAIAEGSTIVRIGTAIFGKRITK